MKERALRVTSEKKEEVLHALLLVSTALLANLHYSLMLHVSAMVATRSGVSEIGCLVVICLCAQLILNCLFGMQLPLMSSPLPA